MEITVASPVAVTLEVGETVRLTPVETCFYMLASDLAMNALANIEPQYRGTVGYVDDCITLASLLTVVYSKWRNGSLEFISVEKVASDVEKKSQAPPTCIHQLCIA